jgi:hypothetical protein
MVFKHSVRTAKKTLCFTITKTNRLTLCKEIIAVYCERQLPKFFYILLCVETLGETRPPSYAFILCLLCNGRIKTTN